VAIHRRKVLQGYISIEGVATPQARHWPGESRTLGRHLYSAERRLDNEGVRLRSDVRIKPGARLSSTVSGVEWDMESELIKEQFSGASVYCLS